MEMETIAQNARDAAIQLAAADTEAKNLALAAIARALEAERDAIVAANR
nr:hypothetical protein [Desulfobacterales bacterium]